MVFVGGEWNAVRSATPCEKEKKNTSFLVVYDHWASHGEKCSGAAIITGGVRGLVRVFKSELSCR